MRDELRIRRVNETFTDEIFRLDFPAGVEVNNQFVGDASDDAADDKQPSTSDLSADVRSVRGPLYNPDADAKADIAAALERARRDNKHVLVKFGGNWCGWCYKLSGLFETDKAVGTMLRENYELVLVDVDLNRELLASYGKDNERHGFPFLTVLDQQGNVLTNQNTSSLEEGSGYDVSAIVAFLSEWQPDRQDARKLLAEALARPRTTGSVFSYTSELHPVAGAMCWTHFSRETPNYSAAISST